VKEITALKPDLREIDIYELIFAICLYQWIIPLNTGHRYDTKQEVPVPGRSRYTIWDAWIDAKW
jgi:hypothetical protein